MTRIHSWRAVHHRGRPLLFLLALAAVVAALVLASRAAPRRNLLLVTIDTLRADALDEGDTPALHDLARRGMRFTRARTPVPLTLAAHASLLSGVDPRRHGIRTNTAVPLPPRLERDYTLLAEELRDAGYATAAFVASSVLDPRYGLSAGFDTYRHPELQGKGAVRFETRDAAEQVALVRDWMRARPADRPFFVWVHLWEPHAPYREYAGDERRAGTSAETDSPRELYRGEVRKADWAVERLLELVDVETTVVAVTSDHGESLGEHGEATHGYLCYGATMDVPLVLAGPGVSAGETNDRVCDLMDLAPALRSLLGVRSAGKGLLALPRWRTVVGESLYAYGLYRWAQQSVAYDGKFSLVDGGAAGLELYDLATDPAEERPLPDPAAQPGLDRALTLYRANEDARAGGAALPPAQGSPYGQLQLPDIAFLRPQENRALPAVRPRLKRTEAVLHRLNAAVAARQAEAARLALAELDRLREDDPRNPALALARGRALLLVLGRPAEAADALEEAIRLGYPRGPLEGLLGKARGR